MNPSPGQLWGKGKPYINTPPFDRKKAVEGSPRQGGSPGSRKKREKKVFCHYIDAEAKVTVNQESFHKKTAKE